MKRIQIILELALATALLAAFVFLVSCWVGVLKEEFSSGNEPESPRRTFSNSR